MRVMGADEELVRETKFNIQELDAKKYDARFLAEQDQLEKVRVDVGRVDDAETSLLQLQRQKEIEDKQYRYYVSRLEESRVEEGLGPGRVSNIGDIQRPSPPFTDALPLYKLMLGCVFGGLGLGVLLAFLSDFVFDQSIRHVHEIEKSLHTPVFVTIPELKLRNSKFIESSHGTEDSKEAEKTLANTNGEVPLALKKGLNGEAENPTYDVPGLDIRNGELLEFHDALRDRLIRHFEVEGLTRKPKLVAITSCLDKSGVTTTAAGLAASLSETGDGNVLLVDMTGERGDVHPFSRGKPVLRLPEALEKDRRSEALVQYNLYVASAEDHSGDPNFMRLLPRRFSHLVPQLKASDYDYVIFDMPPVSQTSVTAKISGAMDINLLVVEAEKTSRGATNAALDLLKASSAKTAVVINRKRGYVPKWLHAGDTI